MRGALRSRSTLLIVAALIAGGAGGFALGRATDDGSATTVSSPNGFGGVEESVTTSTPKLVEKRLVPTTLGQDRPKAVSILRDAGFGVAVEPVPNPEKPGTVLEQHPTAGSVSPKGSTVTLTVSLGTG